MSTISILFQPVSLLNIFDHSLISVEEEHQLHNIFIRILFLLSHENFKLLLI